MDTRSARSLCADAAQMISTVNGHKYLLFTFVICSYVCVCVFAYNWLVLIAASIPAEDEEQTGQPPNLSAGSASLKFNRARL